MNIRDGSGTRDREKADSDFMPDNKEESLENKLQ
jgi:hypothetical protein